jgi:hypothetical protein
LSKSIHVDTSVRLGSMYAEKVRKMYKIVSEIKNINMLGRREGVKLSARLRCISEDLIYEKFFKQSAKFVT